MDAVHYIFDVFGLHMILVYPCYVYVCIRRVLATVFDYWKHGVPISSKENLKL